MFHCCLFVPCLYHFQNIYNTVSENTCGSCKKKKIWRKRKLKEEKEKKAKGRKVRKKQVMVCWSSESSRSVYLQIRFFTNFTIHFWNTLMSCFLFKFLLLLLHHLLLLLHLLLLPFLPPPLPFESHVYRESTRWCTDLLSLQLRFAGCHSAQHQAVTPGARSISLLSHLGAYDWACGISFLDFLRSLTGSWIRIAIGRTQTECGDHRCWIYVLLHNASRWCLHSLEILQLAWLLQPKAMSLCPQ